MSSFPSVLFIHYFTTAIYTVRPNGVGTSEAITYLCAAVPQRYSTQLTARHVRITRVTGLHGK